MSSNSAEDPLPAVNRGPPAPKARIASYSLRSASLDSTW